MGNEPPAEAACADCIISGCFGTPYDASISRLEARIREMEAVPYRKMPAAPIEGPAAAPPSDKELGERIKMY